MSLLDDDHAQFARLLSEIRWCGLSQEQMESVARSMGISVDAVEEIFDRAEGILMSLLDDDHAQFTRLLSEIRACGLSQEQMESVARPMGISVDAVEEIFARANSSF